MQRLENWTLERTSLAKIEGLTMIPTRIDLHPEIVGDADITLTNDFLDSLSLKDRYRHFCSLTSSCKRFVSNKKKRDVHNMRTIIIYVYQ
ncbi:hypothetical protein CAJAP_07212 [Camponotus japonicus]